MPRMAFFRSLPKRRASTPIMDPWQLLRQHSDALASAARGILTELADAQLAGVIVAPGADRGDELRALLAECHGTADPAAVCVGIVPRARVSAMLQEGPADEARAGAGGATPQQLLPIVVASSNGLRIGSVPCGLGGAAEGC